MAASTAVRNRPGTRAKVRYVRMSASKARVVLNLIRGKRVTEALEILQFTERLAADPITKCLNSAVANAEHNEELDVDDLMVSACYADEGPTIKRFRPRARGRAGRIHKQTCHITVEVARLTDEEIEELRTRSELKDEGRRKRQSSKRSTGGDRARRVAKSKTKAGDDAADTADDANDDADDKADKASDEAVEAVDDQVEDQVAEDAADTEDAVDTADADSEDAVDTADADTDAEVAADEADTDAEAAAADEEKQ